MQGCVRNGIVFTFGVTLPRGFDKLLGILEQFWNLSILRVMAESEPALLDEHDHSTHFQVAGIAAVVDPRQKLGRLAKLSPSFGKPSQVAVICS